MQSASFLAGAGLSVTKRQNSDVFLSQARNARGLQILVVGRILDRSILRSSVSFETPGDLWLRNISHKSSSSGNPALRYRQCGSLAVGAVHQIDTGDVEMKHRLLPEAAAEI